PGVIHAVGFPGLSINGFVNLPNAAVMFITLDDFDRRRGPALSGQALAQTLNRKFSAIKDARVIAVSPPPVQGLGTTGGFKLYLQDRAAHGYDDLARVTTAVIDEARKEKEF